MKVVSPATSGPEARTLVNDTSARGKTLTVAEAWSSSVPTELAGVESGSAASDALTWAVFVDRQGT